MSNFKVQGGALTTPYFDPHVPSVRTVHEIIATLSINSTQYSNFPPLSSIKCARIHSYSKIFCCK